MIFEVESIVDFFFWQIFTLWFAEAWIYFNGQISKAAVICESILPLVLNPTDVIQNCMQLPDTQIKLQILHLGISTQLWVPRLPSEI